MNSSQVIGLQTAHRIYEDHYRQYKAGTMAKNKTIKNTEVMNDDGSTTYIPERHWAENEEMPYQEKMRMRSLPSSYKKESPMVLIPPKRSDITDTTLRDRGQTGEFANLRFDSEGYQNDEVHKHDKGPLAKDLFYISPYMTCENCNGLVYVDAERLRSLMNLKDVEGIGKGPGLLQEPLPPCPGCGRTNTFRIGADDLTLLLASNLEELERRKRVQKRMAIKLQKCYRYYLRRRYGRAQRHAILIRRMLEARCACAIQACARGRLGRRRIQVERALVVIKNAHEMLLSRALHSKDYHKKVFWYKTKTETNILYKNYYMLVERTGFNPPTSVVEANIKEIAQRILDREAELATRMQSRWRGITVRKYLGVYRKEVTRVREIMAACVFTVQKMFRGYLGRERCRQLRLEYFKNNLMDEYQTLQFQKEEKRLIGRQNDKLKAYYSKERKEERSARFTGLTNPKLHNGKKMKAFHESSYGFQDVQVLMDEFMEDVVARKERDDDLEQEKKDKAEWIRQEQLKDKGRYAYFEDQVKARRIDIIKRLTKERPVRSVKDLLQKHNSKGIKFEYPKTCYSDPLAILKEEIVHNKIVRDKDGKRVKQYQGDQLEGTKTHDPTRRGALTIELVQDMKSKEISDSVDIMNDTHKLLDSL